MQAAQLELFEGPHLPLARCREALRRLDLAGAGAELEALRGDAAADGDRARLSVLADQLARAEPACEAIHDRFAAVLHTRAGPGTLAASEWFGVYARLLARVLEASPHAVFRGWRAAHYWLVVGEVERAVEADRRLAGANAPGNALVEAARVAAAAGDLASAWRWFLAGCLRTPEAVSSEPPRLVPSGCAALDAAPRTLGPLPRALAQLLLDTDDLELPAPCAGWAPALALVEGRVLLPAVLEALSVASIPQSSAADPPPLAFLHAAVDALRARSGLLPRDRCSDAELEARGRMKALAPELLARYLDRLGLFS